MPENNNNGPASQSNLPTPSSVKSNSNSSSLPPTIQHEYEARFGADLSQVRVHEGHAATLQGSARAFTAGHDIFFAPGTYQPHTDEGRQLLAHELTHVVQQSGRCGPASMVAGAVYDGK